MRTGARFTWLLAVGSLALGAGCGSGDRLPTAPVRGAVTLDGRPVVEGEVIFLPAAGRPSRGKLDADGAFVLGVYAADGAVVGLHRVGIVAHRGEVVPESDIQAIEWLVPERYANPLVSGLTFDVQAGQKNVAKFELTTQP